ncbi:bifunctional tRNA pseudouridine(32) synthase/23S rRNA pseudouridine(746) synthase RluA [Oceanisphaera pacifica]|uniref:Pseudouridine synthase n=1 Tax=Oceanisphaera pacifica TaxID=2818389 RepID=A0ABS3NBR1_9GAMM|nr:bifunctional tRNA pseudouridine(32) synthase/23S rRNA pseudouridine(746) synthase RluA [Oceanisphaera pacifica]MBO1518036.1 bifunctional tRNA pseudouridine(32) synthase/23S rRNA pseudouridine(746) synthase RluA [Oceanisphaera pacifica]
MALLAYNPPMDPAFEILYQDDSIIVLNKPSGLLSVPGRERVHHDSLALRVARVYPTAKIVHRLDMATSGVIVIALHAKAHSELSRQFRERETAKRYYAWVYGRPAEDAGSVDVPLCCDWPNRPRQMVNYEYGKAALTHWRCLRRLADRSLVELTPITGRSHQLRVHMKSLGHVILGDNLYAEGEALTMAPHLLLHASELAFYHPDTHEWLTFTAPAPFDMS